MSGIKLENGVLTVERDPNELDRLALDVSSVLSEMGIEHAFVAGYVAILVGRSRATEDIDVILEPLGRSEADELGDRLDAAGFWGSAMPLSDLHSMLSSGDNIRVARDGDLIPNVELKYASDEFDRVSLKEAITGKIGTAELPIGQLELQIAYKLYLDTQKDYEDAVHLYTMFEESLNTAALEEWVEKLDVQDSYDRLERA